MENRDLTNIRRGTIGRSTVFDTEYADSEFLQNNLSTQELYAYSSLCTIKQDKRYRHRKGREEKARMPRTKEIKMRLRIGSRDYLRKLNDLRNFLGTGYEVKVTVFPVRHEKFSAEKCGALIEEIISDCTECGCAENVPEAEGQSVYVRIVPRKGYAAS